MLARNETIFKWALYAGATAVFFLLQGAVLQRITLWGVIPFVFPILVAVLGMYEGPLPRLRLRPDGGSAVRLAAAGVHPLLLHPDLSRGGGYARR